MKPTITPERLYNGADMTQLLQLTFLEGCYRLIHLLEEAKEHEVSKPMHECDYELLKAQNDAQSYWRGIVKMATSKPEESWLSWKKRGETR